MPTPKGGAETGVANPDAPVENNGEPRKDPKLTARELALASMDAKILAQRESDHAEALAAGNPIALALEAERLGVAQDDESFEARTSPRAPIPAPATRRIPEVSGMDESEEDPTPSEPMAPAPRAAAKPRAAAAPGTVVADPLAGFLVVKDGKPMVRLMVDGKETLIDAEKARAQLQKFNAGDLRLQQATEARKQLERERADLVARETAVAARERTQPSATPPADADPALQTEARDLVKSLMSDTPDEAAAKMVKVLARTRQTAPVVNEAVLIEKAAVAAKKSIKEDETKKDVVTGFTEFQRDYPEIAEDPNLFRYADGLTDAIVTEHPDWAPSQVMAEAGKQTRAWLESLGAPKPPAPKPTPPAVPAVNSRQLAKEQLRPMPVVRAVRRAAEDGSKDNASATPHDVLAEIRRSRGQAA